MFIDETCANCYWRSLGDLNLEDVESISTKNHHALHKDKSKNYIFQCTSELLNSDALKEYDPNMKKELKQIEKKMNNVLAKKRKVSHRQ